MSSSRKISIAVGIIVLAALAWILIGPSNDPIVDNPEESLPPGLKSIRSEAYQLQIDQDWCKAHEKWDELLKSCQGKYPSVAKEARTNSKLVQQQCNPGKDGEEMVGPGESVPVPELAPDDRPETVPEDSLAEHFPVDKTIKSIGLMDLTGRGSNKEWFWQSEAHFAYEGRVLIETAVVNNTGTRVTFEVHVGDISQSLAISDKILRLAPIDSPILEILWRQAEPMVESAVPLYRVARQMADALITIDPHMEKTMTWFYDRLKQQGVDLALDAELQLIAEVGSLSGHRFQLDYVPGFGVKNIKVLKGLLLPKDDVTRFAQRSGVLMNYVMSKVLKTDIGKTFEVRVEDVLAMIGLHYDVDARGTLTLKREPDDEDGLAVMSIVRGEVAVEGKVKGERRAGTMRPEKGIVKYDKESKIVTWAQIDWHSNLNWASEDHLLFGTKSVRDVEAKSHYEAEASKK